MELYPSIIYGVVRSRRLKASLGINLMPTRYKLCPFNCVYCHWGFTDIVSPTISKQRIKDLPSPQQVKDALEQELRTIAQNQSKLRYLRRSVDGKLSFFEEEGPLRYITFSGTGEATLHPQFDEIVELVREVRDRLLPEVKLAILSNSALVYKKEIREALEKLDVKIMKLDAGVSEGVQAVNRPYKGFSFEKMVEGLKALRGTTVQTIFMQGKANNANTHAVGGWIEKINEIRPLEAQIYTVDRAPALAGIDKVKKEKLEDIAQEAETKTGIPIRVY